MIVSGLQKMTLLDYPGKIACTVFLQGCNFRCPFCHNSDLLGGPRYEGISEAELLRFLEKRKGLLEGVCITGGEPTLSTDLPSLMRKIRNMGYAIKLDTNGYRPDVLQQLVAEGLVDYVAMDIKNAPGRYGMTAGIPEISLERLEESIRYLLTGELEYEFRTTVVSEFHDVSAMEEIGRWLHGLAPQTRAKRYFLQCFTDRDSVLQAGLHSPKKQELETFVQILTPFVENITIRGVD